MSYLLHSDGCVQQGDSLIPPDPENRDYQEYLAWVAAGNVPDEAEQPPVPVYHNWDLFRSLMMQHADYQTMLITVMSPGFGGAGNWLGTTMQQAISMPIPSLDLVRPLWNQIVNLSPPTLDAVTEWRGYVALSNVPIVFSDNGFLS